MTGRLLRSFHSDAQLLHSSLERPADQRKLLSSVIAAQDAIIDHFGIKAPSPK
ncbi:hypothetical protein [Streptomyces sp. NRRL S-813]|uniref:hypothetical protein n=1 Tax=Streptomyces sp. NRRL S-813 TaxID=1463919 RepID=UPI000ABB74F0|nr:hypothetical protein [Streptomyces sp. NRRL S-813]